MNNKELKDKIYKKFGWEKGFNGIGIRKDGKIIVYTSNSLLKKLIEKSLTEEEKKFVDVIKMEQFKPL